MNDTKGHRTRFAKRTRYSLLFSFFLVYLEHLMSPRPKDNLSECDRHPPGHERSEWSEFVRASSGRSLSLSPSLPVCCHHQRKVDGFRCGCAASVWRLSLLESDVNATVQHCAASAGSNKDNRQRRQHLKPRRTRRAH